MNRKQWKLWLAGGAGVAVVATVAAISGPAISWAQEATPAAPTSEQRGSPDGQTESPDGRHGGGPGAMGGFGRGDFGRGDFGRSASSENLAEALGISVDELNAAKVDAANAAVDEALAAGLITEEQASALRERIAGSDGDLGRLHFGMGFQRPIPGDENADSTRVQIDFNQLLADALGITTDELNAAEESARAAALADALAAGEITQAQVDQMEARSALRDYLAPGSELSYEEAVAAALADGAITQTQADALLEAGERGPRGEGFGAPSDMPDGARPGGFGPGGMGPRGRGGEGTPSAPGEQSQPTSPLEESSGTQG